MYISCTIVAIIPAFVSTLLPFTTHTINVDRDIRLTNLLKVFVSDLDLSVCDLQFRDKIHYI